ncbi:alpha/beta hydrolase [Paracoccus sp. p3-h83]|uniref:alpha/beta hydrolase n=1 Tax=Paracoccus sp. p3-h83 TaxID=3342805 RepID=UPI0035BA9318
MRRLMGAAAFGALLVGAVFAIGPREPVHLTPRAGAADLGADLAADIAAHEAGVDPDLAARVIWAGAPGAQTDWAVIYLHGFSATPQEIRPVPDRVAAGLGANLYFARLAGHGQGGDAMAGPTVRDWMDDTARALAIGHRLGRRVLVIATSTGGTLAAEAARQQGLGGQIDALVLISPNFGLNSSAATILTWPFARHWGPLVAGRERCFDPINADHARFWTTCYPTVALFPMAALADHAARGDYADARQPLLVLTAGADQVVSPATTAQVAARWGGPVTAQQLVMGPGDDPYAHVIAGDILSPSQTGPVSDLILDWARAID